MSSANPLCSMSVSSKTQTLRHLARISSASCKNCRQRKNSRSKRTGSCSSSEKVASRICSFLNTRHSMTTASTKESGKSRRDLSFPSVSPRATALQRVTPSRANLESQPCNWEATLSRRRRLETMRQLLGEQTLRRCGSNSFRRLVNFLRIRIVRASRRPSTCTTRSSKGER